MGDRELEYSSGIPSQNEVDFILSDPVPDFIYLVQGSTPPVDMVVRYPGPSLENTGETRRVAPGAGGDIHYSNGLKPVT